MRVADGWTIADARALYRIPAWSDGFFDVNEAGHVVVRPIDGNDLTIDIQDVLAETQSRNIRFPLLLRFQDILHARVRRLNRAFATAIEDSAYGNLYRGVYPIKVNQLHEVLEEVIDAGKPFGLGLECGSKAELVATIPHLESDDSLLVCNGVKDEEMLALIVATQSLGKNVIPVMEKFVEFEQLMTIAAREETRAPFGVRIRLRTSGAGKWAASGGYRSKFGISLPELIDIVEALERENARESLVLLHFHLGSQITEIQQLRSAAKEMAQIYAELHARGVPVRYLDVGGGVGVNYTGDFDEGSINYSLQEYANTIVYAVKEVCDERGVPHPVLVSESGRAMTAHHSVLVVETLGAFRKDRAGPDYTPPAKSHRLVQALYGTLEWLRQDAGNEGIAALVEAYHDVEGVHQEASALFGMGYLSLEDNARVERLYWSACSALLTRMRALDPDPAPVQMQQLEELLADQYLCNFSVFQSMLDHWAIDQPFPIMPLARLDERPTRRTILVDLTCDSDGKVSQYVSANEDKSYLELHPIREGEAYHLGVFLTGAYQDIMGDAHNLFGRVTEVHIYGDADEENNFWLEKVIPGSQVHDMLAQVQYFPNDLRRRMQDLIKQKIDADAVRPKRGMQILDRYMAFFDKQTYYEGETVPEQTR
ncbi:MAG TPA: biosynthetic arginine decarboxylase [Woeseiaceae bacterium]|nr:biosynthetic arginine decarboxylase [Woeseiaceae bacterium]